MKRNDEAELRGRARDLRGALDRAGASLDPSLVAQVERVIEGAGERLDLGVDHTVVALVGGTGSGKSSLFNAVSGLNFADVGARRPTTSTLAACSWSEDSSRLLDWLGVDPDRRINRISELDADEEDDLAGLILLDLPDYDSIAAEHRAVVDQVLPMVDLLVWVVDPQKYADDALHSGYLEGLTGAQASMLVVLNQIDTVVESQRVVLLEDVARLLAADGLQDVETVAVSALTGDGIAELRARLAQIVAKRSVAAARVADELGGAAQRVASTLSGQVPRSVDKYVDVAVAGLSEIIGLDARADVVGSRDDDGVRLASSSELAATSVEPVRAGWVAAVGQHLAPRWQQRLDRDVPGPEVVAEKLNAALGKVRTSSETGRRTGLLRTLAWVAAGAAVIVGIVAIALVAGWLADDGGSGVFAAVAAAVLALVAAGLGLAAKRSAAADARERRESYRERATARITDVVRMSLAEPTVPLLEDHHEARTLALAAIDTVTTGAQIQEISTD